MVNTTRSLLLLRRQILAAANRMMSTHRHTFSLSSPSTQISFSSPRSPWMLLEPRVGGATFNFWCFAEEKEYVFHFHDAKKNILEMKLLGSSPGWLAFQHRHSGNIFLLDPVSYDAVDLPPWIDYHMKVKTLVFSESERKAFVIFGSGHVLALCSTTSTSTSTRDGWTLFGGSTGTDKYESMVYSTAHRRLFCITSSLKLEAWDVGHDSPRLDWVAHLDNGPHPDPPRSRSRVKYLACEEQSGQLFLVVGGGGFKVYRIDQGLILLMRNSLEGMAFFVGKNNQAIAIAMRDVGAGVEPNSVYFTWDSRFEYPGCYDYLEKSTDDVSCPNPPEEEGHGPYPVWFTPHPRHIILLP